MLKTDYHIHILPGIDDGPKEIAEATLMLKICEAQGVERLIATPHYIPHRKSVEDFLINRRKSLSALQDTFGITILPGVEVYVEKELAENEQLGKLTLAQSQYILLELPYTSYKEWMLAEIYNIMHGHNLIPVIAHIDRYLNWYTRDDMSRLLSIREAVFQINTEALSKRQSLNFAVSLIRVGFPVIFGSDAHNIHDRPPNMEAAYKALRSKLSKDELFTVTKLSDNLI